MDDILDLEAARRVLAAQPFSVLLGARLVDFGDGAAVLELDAREDLYQHFGFLHGGVLGFAADNALAFAAGTAVGAGLITTGLAIDFLRPADGAVLRAEARILRAGRTRVVGRCDLLTVAADGTRRLCAVAQGAVAVSGPRGRRETADR